MIDRNIVPTEAELRDFIIGNLYWLGTASREKAEAWLDDAIRTHTRYEGKPADEIATMWVKELARAEAAEVRVKELEAALDREKLHAAQWARRNEELEAKLETAKLACADSAEAALQAAPDYEAMHTMVRAAIMQAGNVKGE